MSPYEALADLAERELHLVSVGEISDLPALDKERTALLASLPPVPPATARPALERASVLQARTTAVLQERLAETGAELRRLSKGRSAIRGYAPRIERNKLVDRAG